MPVSCLQPAGQEASARLPDRRPANQSMQATKHRRGGFLRQSPWSRPSWPIPSSGLPSRPWQALRCCSGEGMVFLRCFRGYRRATQLVEARAAEAASREAAGTAGGQAVATAEAALLAVSVPGTSPGPLLPCVTALLQQVAISARRCFSEQVDSGLPEAHAAMKSLLSSSLQDASPCRQAVERLQVRPRASACLFLQKNSFPQGNSPWWPSFPASLRESCEKGLALLAPSLSSRGQMQTKHGRVAHGRCLPAGAFLKPVRGLLGRWCPPCRKAPLRPRVLCPGIEVPPPAPQREPGCCCNTAGRGRVLAGGRHGKDGAGLVWQTDARSVAGCDGHQAQARDAEAPGRISIGSEACPALTLLPWDQLSPSTDGQACHLIDFPLFPCSAVALALLPGPPAAHRSPWPTGSAPNGLQPWGPGSRARERCRPSPRDSLLSKRPTNSLRKRCSSWCLPARVS